MSIWHQTIRRETGEPGQSLGGRSWNMVNASWARCCAKPFAKDQLTPHTYGIWNLCIPISYDRKQSQRSEKTLPGLPGEKGEPRLGFQLLTQNQKEKKKSQKLLHSLP